MPTSRKSLSERTFHLTVSHADSDKVYCYAQVLLKACNDFREAESAGKHDNTYFKPFFRQVACQPTLQRQS